MASTLTQAVLVRGEFFPAGTAREGRAAEVVPDAFWSVTSKAKEAADEQTEASTEPPRTGKGSGAQAWREYATSRGIDVPEDASREDIIAAVDDQQ